MRRLLPLLLLLPLTIAFARGRDAGLELLPPPGSTRAEVERLLDDDLDAGVAGAVPVALMEALCELRPERFGRTVDELHERWGWLRVRGRRLPAGVTERRILGVRMRNYNCLACHAGEDEGRLVIGQTNRSLDFTGFYTELFLGTRAVARDACEPVALARMVAAAGRHRARRGDHLSPTEGAAIVAAAGAWLRTPVPPEPPAPYGPGRTVVAAAYRKLRFDMDPGPFAPVKPPDLFGVRARRSLLWTGIELYADDTPVVERIARNGLLVPWVQAHPLTGRPVPDEAIIARLPRHRRMAALLANAAPPPAPAPREAKAHARGREVFVATCARCHGEYDQTERDGRVVTTVRRYEERLVPVETVGTDPAYERANDRAFARRIKATPIGQLFAGSEPSGAYVARPLLGVRLRFPYLHDGSVPSLRALLTPPGERPRRFHVGADAALDGEAVGYSSEKAPAGPRAQLLDTAIPGNGAQGHPFGTALPEGDKRALIEYLRSL